MSGVTDLLSDPPMGKLEMADMFGIVKRSAHLWRQRGILPPADFARINGSEAWLRSTLLLWAAETNRLGRLSPEHQRMALDLVAARREAVAA